MATGQGAFDKRERAAEQVWIQQEERTQLIKRLEKLVEQGRLERSVLESVRAATAPDPHHPLSVESGPGRYKEVPGEKAGRSPRDYVYDHKPGTAPLPKPSEVEAMRMMPHVDLGPGRWASTHGEGSIFSWREMESLGREAPVAMRAEDAAKLARRAARLVQVEAQMQPPTVLGWKVRLPGWTPGRALVWGSILAVGGTAALVAASARGMGVKPSARGGAQQPLAPDV